MKCRVVHHFGVHECVYAFLCEVKCEVSKMEGQCKIVFEYCEVQSC